MIHLPGLPQMPTYDETRQAVRALMDDDDPKPLRQLKWRAFWHGFTHPFGMPFRLREKPARDMAARWDK